MRFSPDNDPTARALGGLMFLTILSVITMVTLVDLSTPGLQIVAALPIIPAVLLFLHHRRVAGAARG